VSTDRQFACLTYHAVGDSRSQYTVSIEQLESHLAFLKAEGYLVEDFEQLESRLRSGQLLPTRYAVLTVDDGHESAMIAADLLEKHQCKSTFFVTRDRSLAKPGYIREGQIRELRRRGFSVGTHGTTHRKLTFLSKEDCLEELKGSREWLEDVLGEAVYYMAMPGGYVNAYVLRTAQEQGYVLTGTCNEWMNSAQSMRLPGVVNRVNVRRHFSIADFQRILEGNRGFYLWRQVRAATLMIPKQVLR
jgi:peptidoglycan/xylan/chitin deacetylase (PgdA/CDA1 family)